MELLEHLRVTDTSQEAFAAKMSAELGREIRQSTISKMCNRKYTPSLGIVLLIKRLTDGQVTEADWPASGVTAPPKKRARRAGA
jgi:hypothetical protein